MGKFFLMIAIVTSSVFALEVSKIENRVPPEVQQVMDNALKGDTGSDFSDFDRWKVKFGFDKSTKLSDVKAGYPAKMYYLLKGSVIKVGDTISVSALITNLTDEWEFPLFANGKMITFCELVKNKNFEGQWHVSKIGGNNIAREWEKVIKKWPSSAGYHPVMVETGYNRFFYIPEKNDSNLTYLRIIHHANDSLEITTDSTYSTLTSSKVLMRYFKTPHKTARVLPSEFKGGNPK